MIKMDCDLCGRTYRTSKPRETIIVSLCPECEHKVGTTNPLALKVYSL